MSLFQNFLIFYSSSVLVYENIGKIALDVDCMMDTVPLKYAMYFKNDNHLLYNDRLDKTSTLTAYVRSPDL